jgi:putative membrane protein
MLRRYHSFTIALLTGFMLGSLNKVWPWKQVLQTYTNSKGEIKPLIESNVLPWHYQEISGNDPQLALAIGLAILGFAVVYAIEKLAGKNTEA